MPQLIGDRQFSPSLRWDGKEPVAPLMRILREDDQVASIPDQVGRMLIFHDHHLTRGVIHSKIVVEAFLQIRTSKIIVIPFRLVIREKRRIKADRKFKLRFPWGVFLGSDK